MDDLDLFAGLGVQALRYPVLWERTSPDKPDVRDFAWSDARIGRLEQLGVRPIVGLCHHGSGPAYTSLVAADFAPGLARHARAVAERYPQVRDWTPVNEPLTTARFSCLYGHWYPHQRDEGFFWLALLNQIDATRLAMAEIRRINPQARLIQTEDLGRTYSTPVVRRQADFENERRWLTWDLLGGRVTAGHPLHDRIAAFGFGDRLRAIADDPCPPDVIGINHYVTSERFLDDRIRNYPAERVGGDGEMRYADVEAVRVLLPGPAGLRGVLDEAWRRYGVTLAVTEAHNGCTREEQVRWIREAWATAQDLRASGVAIEAVTAWALLGSYDWNSLLTRKLDHYESGAFDLRGGCPRPTALAAAIRDLGDATARPHPAATGAGWWKRDIRLEYQPVLRTVDTTRPPPKWATPEGGARPLLITGATGTLGQAIARACEWRGIDFVLTDRAALALDDVASIEAALDTARPWGVINAAGWVRVDEAEAEMEACLEANAAGPLRLARACAERDLRFVSFSSDLVFDGELGRPYVETDSCAPLNVYGRSKAMAEREILALGSRALMVRTAAFFSPHDPHNFAAQVRRTLTSGHEIIAADDLIVSPTYVPDLVEAALDLAIDGEYGIWHLANRSAVSWAEFARMVARTLQLDERMVRGAAAASMPAAAVRPANVSLASARGQLLPSLDNALSRYAAALSPLAFASDAEARLDRRAQGSSDSTAAHAERRSWKPRSAA